MSTTITYKGITLHDTGPEALRAALDDLDEAEQALIYLAIAVSRCGFSDAVVSEIARIQERDPSVSWAKARRTLEAAAVSYGKAVRS